MKAIYDEDQRVRQAEPVDWHAVEKTDAERRECTRKLLAEGALHTGNDYEEAAFVFQHGSSPATEGEHRGAPGEHLPGGVYFAILKFNESQSSIA